MTRDGDEVTALDILASMINKTDVCSTLGACRTVTMPLPWMELATVEALAEVSGRNPHEIVAHLLEIGIEELFDRLNQSARYHVIRARTRILNGVDAEK
jgi:hypothetical protein